jgi:uncharacterized protein (TIGR04255 family)
MGKKLANAPAYYVLGQLRFNTIPGLDNIVPKIVEALKQKYPDYRRDTQASLTVSIDQAGKAQQGEMLKHTNRHVFSNLEKTSGFVIDEGSLTYCTTKYDTFDAFITEVLFGLKVLHEDRHIGVVQRVGLRYLNAIFPEKDNSESLAKMVDSSLLGLASSMNGDLSHSYSETQTKVGNMTCTTRALVRKSEIAFPHDLAPVDFQPEARFLNRQGLHAILDLDSSVTVREIFNLEKVKEAFIQLHNDGVEVSFMKATTDYARNSWGKTDHE